MTPWKSGTTITINGQTYRSPAEMPPDVRREYERLTEQVLADRDGNGVPDLLEGKADLGANVASVVTTSRRYVVNGQTYERWEDMPAEVQRQIEAADGGPEQLSSRGSSRIISHLPDPSRPQAAGDITIHLSWPTIVVLFVCVALAAIIWWNSTR